MLLAGAPLAARQGQSNLSRDRERRDRQLDGPNAPGRVAREERAATSVRRVGGEATVWALDSAMNG
jgi:ribosomal protein S8E